MRATTAPPQASWSELLQGRNGLRSIALAGGVALHAINIYIVTTILPTVIEEIGGLAYYAWNTTLFVVASIVGSAVSARLIDMLGPRLTYLLALLGFSLGTVGCALAPSMPALLAGRTVQGLSGGVLFALSYALIRVVFAPRLWPRAMALVSGMWGVATLGGPAIGGIFAQSGHWRLAFWVMLPVALLLALIVATQLRGKEAGAQATGNLPMVSIALLVLSVLAISVASLSQSLVWNAGCIGMGLIIAGFIVRIDTRSRARLLPTGAYSLSSQLGVLYAIMSLLVVGLTSEIFVPYFLQVIHGMTPLVAGYMTAAMAGGWTVASLYSAGSSEAQAYRLIRISPVIVTIALATLAATIPMTTWSHPATAMVVYCTALACVGFGIGLSWPHLLARVFAVAPPGEETLAASSITTVQLYATSLAAALAGVITHVGGLTAPGGVAGAQGAALALFASFSVAPALAILLAARVTKVGIPPADAGGQGSGA